MRFLPHDDSFFNMFDNQIGLVREAAGYLSSSKTNGLSVADTAKKICELEQQGNTALEEIFGRLNKVFITPLDPEDLHKLAAHVDRILDNVESVAYRLSAYDIDPIPDDMTQLSKLTSQAMEKLCDAFGGLKLGKLKDRWDQISAACQEIARLEHEAQTHARKSVRELLNTEKDPATLIKKKELYDRLQNSSDAVKDTADLLRNVVVKNS